MNEKIIELLNKARARELTAIVQYMHQHYKLEDTDFGKLAKKMKQIAIVEMKHAEALAERILFLGGVPSAKLESEIVKNQTIPEMLATNEKLEQGAIDLYNEAAAVCAQERDQVTKELFDKLVADETDHIDDFQNIKDHVEKLGDVYLATLIGDAE